MGSRNGCEWVRVFSLSVFLLSLSKCLLVFCCCLRHVGKFPASKSYGRYSRKYFILLDNTLTYYKSKPLQEDFFVPHDYRLESSTTIPNSADMSDEERQRVMSFTIGGHYANGKGMLLDETSKVDWCLTVLQPTLKVTTVSTGQTLSLKLKKGTDKEKYWVNSLQKTIEMQSRSKFD
jgi:hypothetical protein